jgi:hypothetical protein
MGSGELILSAKELRSLLRDVPEETDVYVKMPKGLLGGQLRPSAIIFKLVTHILLRPHETENKKYTLLLLPVIDAWES